MAAWPLTFIVSACFLISWANFAGAAEPGIPPERPRARPASELTGWADWEKAEEIWKRVKIPAAPPLPPDEALKTFRVAPGYRLELVAAEPLIANPIFFEFDEAGRIWALEYRGYMRDLEGRGESDPICRLVVLEDVDADGKADRSIPFLEGLAMPRSFAFVEGGVLVAEPPNLWYCQDLNGDLRCDRKTLTGKYGVAGNPQHTANGLARGIDNWLHSADWPKRHRFKDGKLLEEPTIHRGQFGVSFDDHGRYITCRESSAALADLIPAEYLPRNANLFKLYQRGGGRGRFGVEVNIAPRGQEVFPIRPTPAITLGALELRDDGRLRTYTIVAGTGVYRGDQFPDDARGNIFVPEAGGHLIGRLKVSGDFELDATRFYPPEQEFLASTDERFRPMTIRTGPDGALYFADMYHGIIEHVIFLAPYLTKQIKERGLESGNDMGRIYRVVAETLPIDRVPPRLGKASAEELAALLEHRNGWRRDTAQRLLVDGKKAEAVPALKKLVNESKYAPARAHALWTLEGLGALEWKVVAGAARDPDPQVRVHALRLAEKFSGKDLDAKILDELRNAAGAPERLVRLQALLSAGALASGQELAVKLLVENEHPLFATAALGGCQNRETAFLDKLMETSRWKEKAPFRERTLQDFASAAFLSGSQAALDHLLALAARSQTVPEWQRLAILDGVLGMANPRSAPLPLAAEPAVYKQLNANSDLSMRRRATRLAQLFSWPGNDPLKTAAIPVQTLTTAQRELVAAGQNQYLTVCAPCHQPDGNGQPNLAPPLSESEWVNSDPELLIKIILHGLYGPVEVKNQDWNHHMPGFGAALDDTQIASILSFIRQAWGNSAPLVEADRVAALRRRFSNRSLPFTVEEARGSEATAPLASAENVIEPEPSGDLLLPASKATCFGAELRYRPSMDILGPWRREQDAASWVIEPEGGMYDVYVLIAADEASSGDRYVVEAEGARLAAAVKSTGSYDRFEEQLAGSIRLKAGRQRIFLRPEGALKRELADVRGIKLRVRR